ncbi:choice-of-anchor D domain-containing protein [uncultured Microscilla sp.]|uniref:choice-of-anchor D domain-containing protein n=1 Tax=uncultured Microscilla sp. TaxID=432653 RepID=UPI00261BD7BB|nr:choice-of-anchor D domain-containing protein [uncultured Microscilla sp.]
MSIALLLCFVTHLLSAQNISTIAGGGTGATAIANDITAMSADLGSIHGLVSDEAGNLYIASTNKHYILKVNASDGKIVILAGDGTQNSTGDGALASNAQVNAPRGLFLLKNGDLYFVEGGTSKRIRKINASDGKISTVAGGGANNPGDGGAATDAVLTDPFFVYVDNDNGDIYFTEYNGRKVRKVNGTDGKISTIAGNGTASTTGDGGLATAATVNQPLGIYLDAAKNIYFAEFAGHRIRKINASDGKINTIVGTGTNSTSGNGADAGSATINQPTGIHIDISGNLYIAEFSGNVVRKVNASDNKINTIAGGGANNPGNGGLATDAVVSLPFGLTIDANGDMYIPEFVNGKIRKVSYPDLSLKTTANLAVGATHDFGSTTVGSNTGAVTFTAENKGVGNLTLTGSTGSFATLGGTHAGDFSISQANLTSPIAQSSSKTFTVTFTPTAAGSRNATLTINSDDPNENPYTIKLTGTATACNAVNAGSIGSAQTICSGGTPALLTSATAASGGNGSFTYQWQSSGDGTNFSNIAGATSTTYQPPALTQNAYYRRTAISGGGCGSANSAHILITVNAPQAPAVSITSDDTDNTITTGTKVIFTAAPTNGGTSPTYQWKVNGTDVSGATAATFEKTDLSNGDKVSVTMTTSASCVTSNTATSNEISITVSGGSGSPTALPNQPNQAQLSVYPNPSSNRITLKFTGKVNTNIQVYILDELGRSVATHTGKLSTGVFTIPVHSLPKGIYLLKISLGKETILKRITKK